jgi:transcriptional repressor NrdR
MKCPFCGFADCKVIDSRPINEGESIRRRRECLSCGKRFTSYETIEQMPIVVMKKDESRQQFDKQKLISGMLRACEKRPVPIAALQKVADEVEQELQNSFEREVRTCDVGEIVLKKLKTLDEVAYVRFASVYRQFQDINSFMQELNKMLEAGTGNNN